MADVSYMEQQQMMAGLTEQQKQVFLSRYNTERKDRLTLLLVSIFFGKFGVDRFIMGDIPMGLLKLFTLGCCGVLWIIDICTIQDRVDAHNRELAHQIIAYLHQNPS